MPVERFTRADLEATPWKNGGGVTREIVCRPAGSGMDRFDWRVSIAEISADGSFSIFAGIDRVIMLLDGNGVDMRSSDRAIDHRLHDPLVPFVFSGDTPIDASLIAGSSSDFNVMTRRARRRATVHVLETWGDVEQSRGGVLLAARGTWHANATGEAGRRAVSQLEPGAGLWWDDEPYGWSLTTTDTHAALIAVRISPCEA